MAWANIPYLSLLELCRNSFHKIQTSFHLLLLMRMEDIFCNPRKPLNYLKDSFGKNTTHFATMLLYS
jgi:hypothetical protein